MAKRPTPKPAIWMGSSRKDLGEFPAAVKDRMGYALFVAQQGAKHVSAKVLKGFHGAGVVEIVSSHRGGTFRTIYTVRLAGAVYVRHAFQKKSRTGRETTRSDLDVIDMRLRDAEQIAGGERA